MLMVCASRNLCGIKNCHVAVPHEFIRPVCKDKEHHGRCGNIVAYCEEAPQQAKETAALNTTPQGQHAEADTSAVA